MNRSIIMADDVLQFGFENDDIKGGIYDKYKGKKGEVHRGSLIFTDPKAMFVGAKAHFKDRYFICKKSICCDKLQAPKWRVASVLIKYGTDKQGNVKQPFGYELFPWFFSETTFIKLKNINNEFPLTTHDIKISCTNEEYQHLDITPCNEIIWQAKEEFKKKILEEAKPIWDYIKKGIASDLSIEEIKDLLSVGSSTTDPTSKLDLDSVLKTI
jgi:hypothetical protein